MQNTFQNEDGLKTLEDYAVFLASGLLTLMTLQNIQVRALQLGIMKEDHAERANTIIWDLRRCMNQFKAQTESILEMLPDDFDHNAIIERLKDKELKLAKIMTKKAKVEK
jgi:hypothetical protein